MPVNKLIMALLATTALSGAAHADQAMPNLHTTAIEKPELSGLRYFAKHKQFDRYRAELQRLTHRYPGFVPPANLFNDADSHNQELWELYSRGDMKALEAEIARKKEENPYWQPNEKLIYFVERARKIDRISALSESKEYEALIDETLKERDLLENGSTETIWMIGEALAKLGQIPAAVEAFEYGFQKNTQKDLLPLLVQKSAEVLPLADSEYLYERVLNSQTGINKEVLDSSYTRGLILHTKDYATPFPEHRVASIESFGTGKKEANSYADVLNLAWAYYALADYKKSAHWFSQSPKKSKYAKAIEGEILSLKHLEKMDEARALAHDWHHANDDIAALYLNLSAPKLLSRKVAKLDTEFLTRFAGLTNSLKSGEGAEALGWYAYKINQLTAANAWFDKAIEWDLTETAAFGKTLTAARNKDRQLFDSLKTQYASQYKKVADLKYNTYRKKNWIVKKPPPSVSQKMASAYKKGRYSECVRLYRDIDRSGRAKAHDHQMHGWCLMKLDRAEEAHHAFAKASAQGLGGNTSKNNNTRISLYGAALAALKSGRTTEADQISQSGQLNQVEFKTIRTGVLAQQALETFRHKAYHNTLRLLNERARMVREPANLTELRGWSLYRTGQFQQAFAVFKQLDDRLSTQKTRHALQLTKDKINPVSEYN